MSEKTACDYEVEFLKYQIGYKAFMEKFFKEIYYPAIKGDIIKWEMPLIAEYKKATEAWWDSVKKFEIEHPSVNPLDYLRAEKPNRIDWAQRFINKLIEKLNGEGMLTGVYMSPVLAATIKLSPMWIYPPLEDLHKPYYFTKPSGSIYSIPLRAVFLDGEKDLDQGLVQRIIAMYAPGDVPKCFELTLDFKLSEGFLKGVKE